MMTMTPLPSRAPVPHDLVRVLLELDITVGRQESREIWGLCPMHRKRTGRKDSKPTNWSINSKTGDHYCFACGYRGSLVGLVMDLLYKNDVFSARRWLRQFGVDLDSIEDIPEWSEQRTQPLLAGVPFGEAWLEQFIDPPAEALTGRGISAAAAATYGIRWDPKKKSWILPIREADGTFIGWQAKSATAMRNHPKSIKKSVTLFGLDVFTGGTAYLLESPLDCAVLATAGVPGGLASFGVRVSETQVDILINRADEIVLCLDNDSEGENMTQELLASHARRIRMSVLNYSDAPEAKDVGDMSNTQIRNAVDTALHSIDARR